MVVTINQLIEAKAILLEQKENLKNEGHDISDDIELGIMVNTCNSSISYVRERSRFLQYRYK